MEISYQFDKQYKKSLQSLRRLNRKSEDLISWPKGNLIFRSNATSTTEHNIDPDMFFWWLDRVIGQFENEIFEEYREDILGLPFYLNWKNNRLSITFIDDLKGETEIFNADISKKEVFEKFRDLSKSLQVEMEKINPLVKKSKEWNSYYFVKHYNQTS